ncbi:outer membrane protein transport protein, partial [uncultured Psychrobacter sp.]
GMKFGANKNFQIYGGPVAQRIQSETKLRGLAYGPASGYTSNSNPDMDYGYIAGIAYSKPEIALKAALTYRSEIDHDIDISENYPIAGILAQGAALQQGATPAQAAAIGAAAANRNSNYEITTPKSVNFDFQTGINPTTLATAKVRWVPWSDFVITPPLYNDVSKRNYGPDGLDLVEYEDDQWQVELGLAKRVAPALAISGTVGWDSGAGDPTTSLGPVDGYYSVGLGAKYNVTENWAVSAGGKYLWFGDAKGRLPSGKIVGDFQDNDGYIAGLKISYQGK